MQHDDFYDKLPYTLEQNQTTPEYVIFGTGLQECLIAAYKSKMQGKLGLIIDTQKTYGSSLKTVTFKQYHELTTLKNKQKMYNFITPQNYLQSNSEYYSWCLQNKKHRGFSIDIQPNFFLGNTIACECLKQADMDKYMDFHLVNSILFVHDNQFRPVPLSKGKIFDSKELSLLQKKTLLMSLHKLIKIYQKYMNLEQDLNSTKQFDKDFGDIDPDLYNDFTTNLNSYFLPFIHQIVKKNKKITNYLAYLICNYQYNYQSEIPPHAQALYTLKGFIQLFGKFIKSCGIYGESPYLYVDNGIGDIPQAYSRIASIYGSTYILHPKVTIDSIVKVDDSYQISTNLSPERPITTKQIFFGPTFLQLSQNHQQFYQQKILRVLVLCQKQGKQQHCPAICFITDLPQFLHPVYLFMFDSSTQSCPANLILYQFQTILQQPQTNLQLKSQTLLTTLQKIYGQTFRTTIKYHSVCIRKRRYPKTSKVDDSTSVGLNDTMGIDLDQHFNQFARVVGKQENYFRKDNQHNQEDQEPFGGYDTNYLLQKLDNINLNQVHSEELPQHQGQDENNQDEKEEEEDGQSKETAEKQAQCINTEELPAVQPSAEQPKQQIQITQPSNVLPQQHNPAQST